MGDVPRYGGGSCASDGAFLRAIADVPIVTVGPGERTVPHQVNESVGAHDLVTAARLGAAATIAYLGGDT